MQTEKLHPLNVQCVEKYTPEGIGIYALYNAHRELIFYGKAQKQTLRAKLLQHLNGSTECLDNAAFFSVQMSRNPEKRLDQYLRRYQAINGKQPECNERLESFALRPVRELCSGGVLTTAFLR